MAKKKVKSSGGSGLIVVIILGAVIVVLGLIVLSGGLAPPAAEVTTESLELCNGKPCPSKGSPDAPVVVIEFSDYGCHNCRDFNLTTAPILERDYVDAGKVRYVSHVFSLWPESIPAAAASLCAHEQGKYWEFHEQAFRDFQQGRFPASEDFLNWAQLIGLDQASFKQCVDSGRTVYDAQVSALEGTRAGISGTPSFYINGTLVSGNVPLDEFRRTIDAALAGQ
ncbi:MAG TPA: DsbA family protein [Anaerolineae bacterium]|nr:DsbA family protein [Anaerolineae bacterium]